LKTTKHAHFFLSYSSSPKESRNSRVHSRKSSESCSPNTFEACWRICIVVDNRTLRFSSSARGIIHEYHLPHMSDESVTARSPYIDREKAHFLRCICARAMRIILFLRAIFIDIHRARQRPAYDSLKTCNETISQHRMSLFYSFPIIPRSLESY